MARSHCPKDYPIGAAGMHIDSSDTVKPCYIYLKKEVYKEQRLFSEERVNMVLEREYVF